MGPRWPRFIGEIMKKKIITIFLISFVSFGSFMMGFNINVPSAYAIDQEDIQGWTQAKNTSELVEAFRYYCKSRNLVIDGSIADAVTKVTTTYFNTICNGLGIDITALQAEVYSKTYSNTGLQFLFTQSGISTYNRIFSEFLQNNDLEVGDTDVDKTLYNGSVFTDADGNSVLVYVLGGNYSSGNGYYPNVSPYSDILAYGTPYIYEGSFLYNNYWTDTAGAVLEHTFNLTETQSYTAIYQNFGKSTGRHGISLTGVATSIYEYNKTTLIWDGQMCIFYSNVDNKLYLGLCSESKNGWFNPAQFRFYRIAVITDGDSKDTTVTVTAPVINNNTYNNNTYTVINNNGDTYNVTNYPDDDPSSPGGGGGGDDTEPPYDIPDNPTYDTPDGWGIELPDDITTNNWLLYGLEKKFPWDIPFNMIFALSLLNAEPETPHFTGSIDLKVCTWNYDIDLEPFDTIAGYCREFFFLGFIIGLMLLTRQLIWG